MRRVWGWAGHAQAVGLAFVLMVVCGLLAPARAGIWLLPEAPGYAEISPDGSFRGVAVDVVREVLRRAEVEAEIAVAPAPRALADFLDHRSMFLGFVYDARMDEHALLIRKFGAMPLVAVTRTDMTINGFEDLTRIRPVGVIRNLVPNGPIAEDRRIQRKELRDVEVGLDMLLGRRLDVFVASRIGLNSVARRAGQRDAVRIAQVGVMEFAFYSHRDMIGDPVLDQIGRVVDQLMTDGTYDQILDEHFGPDWRD